MRPSHLGYGCAALAATALALVLGTGAPAVAAPAPPLDLPPTLINSLPYTITAPGTYCVTNDLTMNMAGPGIIVQTNGVTIDLGGHQLSGGNIGTHGVFSMHRTDIVVRNGHVLDWTAGGITASDRIHVHDLAVTSFAPQGIELGAGAIVERVTVEGIMDLGLSVDRESIVRDCRLNVGAANEVGLRIPRQSVAENVFVWGGMTGIEVSEGGTVRHCSVLETSEVGVRATGAAQIDHVESRGSGVAGIEVENGCRVKDCKVSFSVGDGLRVLGSDNRIEANDLRENGTGLRVLGGHNLVVRNMAFENGTDFAIAPLNSVGPILRDFMTITSTNPHANHATPLL